MIIAIDPSTTAIGFASFHDDGRSDSASVIRPDDPRSLAVERVHQMARDLIDMIDEAEAISRVRIAIIEAPPRYQGHKRNPGVQHAAYGVVYHLCRAAKIQTIESVDPSTWTRNKPKEARQWVARRVLGLSANDDKGGDALDAYQLGKWYIARNPSRLIREATE